MMKILLALFLALTGLMVAASPVAVMAMSGAMLCEQQANRTIEHAPRQPASAVMNHSYHATDHGLREAIGTSDEPTADSAPVCCDHACLAELTVMPVLLGIGQTTSSAPHDLSSSDLTELTHPNGLRRPPKA